MRYEDFKAAIREMLRDVREGLTWAELRDRCRLPYERPCPTWTRRLEQEIGLTRTRGFGRALIWKIADDKGRR
jgi:hypothetical protein